MGFHTIVSVDQLAAHIDDVAWRVFDCRHDLTQPQAGEAAYRTAHIPSAHFLHLDRDLSGIKTGSNGRHPLPDPMTFATNLMQRGVSNDTQVIAYDDAGGMFAARLWWLMRWLGHDRVAVLDGSLGAWQRAGYPVTDKLTTVIPGTFRPSQPDTTPTVDTDYVRRHLGSEDMLLVDARAPARFSGETETIDPIGGHIPGAVNRFFQNNLAGDGRFKPATQLRQEFDDILRASRVEHMVNYCGSGATACHNLLALEIAGLRGARLYPGSWSEWCSDPQRPVATGGK